MHTLHISWLCTPIYISFSHHVYFNNVLYRSMELYTVVSTVAIGLYIYLLHTMETASIRHITYMQTYILLCPPPQTPFVCKHTCICKWLLFRQPELSHPSCVIRLGTVVTYFTHNTATHDSRVSALYATWFYIVFVISTNFCSVDFHNLHADARTRTSFKHADPYFWTICGVPILIWNVAQCSTPLERARHVLADTWLNTQTLT